MTGILVGLWAGFTGSIWMSGWPHWTSAVFGLPCSFLFGVWGAAAMERWLGRRRWRRAQAEKAAAVGRGVYGTIPATAPMPLRDEDWPIS